MLELNKKMWQNKEIWFKESIKIICFSQTQHSFIYFNFLATSFSH
jgi:hypothetical protein